ncbi:hypothetical protein GLOIN_2v1593406 [Rhizophagus irregularis DAOM 181602=DAOM 197198]|uniref:Uncharacterized protein n=1 Tax=Rhizophagus irregularis (strain DAOM 181602 / DAOM 197198 / MUCL 43194) TaxID=747089 RepID=U9U104_RHIID|nr:hypothetical protein GLOIN_2v1593406 [Rhizophagus irregularis DAOM 181602=DAOM 197198]
MANPLIFVRQRIQERKVNKLARKCSLTILITKCPCYFLIGFNDVPAYPNLRNGVIAPRPNLPMGSVDYGNHGLLFIFQTMQQSEHGQGMFQQTYLGQTSKWRARRLQCSCQDQ